MIKKSASAIALITLFFTLGATEKEVGEPDKLGGSGYIGIGMLRLDLDPLERIVERDLKRSGFEFDDNRFITVTLGGYFGPRRNGFRIGAAGHSDIIRYIVRHGKVLSVTLSMLHSIQIVWQTRLCSFIMLLPLEV